MSETRVTVNWQSTVRGRVSVAAALLGLWVVGIQVRLIYLQIYAHTYFVTEADDQQLRQRTEPAERGDIVDRNGRILVMSANAPSVIAVPKAIENAQDTIDRICRVLPKCTREERTVWLERFTRRGKGQEFAPVRQHVTDDEATRLMALELPGIGIQQETRRSYPKGSLAAHLLGYVGRDEAGRVNRGLAGIENAYDKYIRGRDGRAQLIVDSRKRPFSSVQQPPTTGATVRLTIDSNLQHIAERELMAAIREHRALGGTVIMQDPHTGEILAMASYPTFDPNDFRSANEASRKNRAVQDVYEPGSTFKIVTASAALNEGLMLPSRPFNVSAGRVQFGARIIRDDHVYGTLTFSDVIVKSSNVGAIAIGSEVGRDRLGAYIKQFGFGRVLSPDFRGESAGIVWDPASLNNSALASVSMGYQVSVTPLQMVTAFSSIANGGRLMEPRIIKSVKGDGVDVTVQPRELNRTVSAETAATMTGIMEGVVEAGTAKAARIPGYTVAGKTGTAAKAIKGGYSQSDYNASFVGFFPSRNPVAAMIVVIDTPRAKGYYGGVVAAPIFQRIAQQTLAYMGVAPSINREPPVLIESIDTPVIRAVAAPIISDIPRIVPISAEIPPGTMPDLRGLGARDAARVMASLGLEGSMTGDGRVIAQSPQPGAPLSGTLTLTLGRVPAPVASSATGQP